MFRRLLFRNLIAMLIPMLVIEVFVLFAAMQVSLMDEYRYYEKVDLGKLDLMYAAGQMNVSFICPDNLTYAGFDYKRDDKKIGEYFYQFDGDSISLYILDNDTAERVKKGEKGFEIFAVLEKDEMTADYVESQYQTESGLDASTNDPFESFVKDMMVNQTIFPARRMHLLRMVKMIDVVIIGLTVLYAIIATVFPVTNLSFNTGDTGKTRRRLIKELDYEMSRALEKKIHSIYFTKNYVVAAYLSGIEIEKRIDLPVEREEESEDEEEDEIIEEEE